MTKIDFLDSGIYYEILLNGSNLEFPIDLNDSKDIVNSTEWEKVQLLEQFWDEGVLLPHENGYLISSIDVYEINEYEKYILGIPTGRIDILLKEHGNVSMPSHHFKYKFLDKGNLVSGLQRKGNVLIGKNTQFLLSKSQWKLIESIDSYDGKSDNLQRSKTFAHIKKLAKKADAKIDSGIEKRNFIFAEEIELGMNQIGFNELKLTPILNELDSKFEREIADNLDNVIILKDGKVDYRVFLDDNTLNKGKIINAIPPIKDAKIPEFTDNPYAFIPEDIDINEDIFSERVKGLKVYKSKAIPFVNIENDGESNDWFSYDSGINVSTEHDADDWQLDDYSEFKQKVDKALENGDSYIYLNEQWIKVDENVKKFLDAREEINEFVEGEKISKSTARRILDIYDNLECIDYHEDIEDVKEQINNPLRTYSVPSLFNGTLDIYQIEGYNFLRIQKETHRGSLMADDMGLGKTVQVIALMSHLLEQQEICPLLLVVPTALIENWISELNKFLPSLHGIYVHRGVSRIKDPNFIKSQYLTITSYETLSRDQVQLGKVKWSYIICDETQKIKNFNTLAANAVKGMNAANRIAMTGTPIENNLGELWSIIDFIQPGLLGSYRQFTNYYEKPLKENPNNSVLKDDLIEKIKPLFIRRTKKDILSTVLPKKQEYVIKISMSIMQLERYQQIIDDVKNNVDGKGQHLAGIQKLIEVCSHPAILDNKMAMTTKDMITQSPKLQKTLELLESVKQKNEKAIIFTRYHKMQAILRKVIFDVFGIDSKIINGGNTRNRMATIEAFQAKEGFNVLILSPKAAGVGLNITGANHVIHYTREWNPAVENQATDRVYRRGQKKDVFVYFPIVCHDGFITVEEKLDVLMHRKQDLMEDIIVVNGLDVQKELESIFN